MSEKTYRAWRPDQAWLLPPSLRDWLPEGHLVYFLMDAVRELEISAITAHYERELRGFPPFHPRMMLTLLIFNYAMGTRSSRKIRTRCEQDVACRVIVGEDLPEFHAISEFRRRHLAAFEQLFVEVLKLASASGLLKVGRLALDGTKIKANECVAPRFGFKPRDELRPHADRRGSVAAGDWRTAGSGGVGRPGRGRAAWNAPSRR